MVTGCSVVVIFMAVANGSKSTLASFLGLWPGNEAKDTQLRMRYIVYTCIAHDYKLLWLAHTITVNQYLQDQNNVIHDRENVHVRAASKMRGNCCCGCLVLSPSS